MTSYELLNQICDFNIINPKTNHVAYNDIYEMYCAGKESDAIIYIQEYYNVDKNFAKDTFELFKSHFKKPSPQQIAQANAWAREQQNIPKCPTCGSERLQKITTTSKVVNTVAFGIFGTKRHKSFHCCNCGYEW